MRVKRGVAAHKRHKKYLKLAKGFRGSRSTLYRTARENVERALCYQYRDRKNRKREFRRLWITRINAASREHGMTYSRLVEALKKADIRINRKILADMAVREKDSFAKVVELAKSQVA